MTKNLYLFDTHALIFWHNKKNVSEDFVKFFDQEAEKGTIYVSSISFWEIALLVKKGRIEIPDVHLWKNEILQNSNLQEINPTTSEMIDSTILPDIHKDPFDRLLISQSNQNKLTLVTKDKIIPKYDVKILWL
ncbi:MAG: type II toxin-antitoxin system VapC family toxin [Deltaproteobacteria bacterium]|nr:type II toxin-antitoxin system VapC family toxin [Deltaproteobacteria bacterium]MBT4526919.1 type II toxin-antitoxin system VapC family toxin [Deltaproteobacteria bacterium]